MKRRGLVLDANILIRAVLGQRVRRILAAQADNISFFVPETAYAEAEDSLRSMAALGTIVSHDLCSDFEAEARKRLGARDPEDWPILAAALALGCPIWTEDTDFFGCGVATWTSSSIDYHASHCH
jgi:predicted nucleic acid-binding protein